MTITPPNPLPKTNEHKVFLAGSIEMDKAERWQDKAIKLLVKADPKVVIFNPRRESWQSDWKQEITNPHFKEQVDWELDALEASHHILMYFDPNTKSPISLLELGLFARQHKLVVVCPEGFWRKGNVDVVCSRFRIPQYATLEEAIKAIV